jgi:MoxR-like ATPase
MVLATQNPIDHEGTYDLPKALLDRFMLKLQMPKLTKDSLERVLRKNCNPPERNGSKSRSHMLEPGLFKKSFHEIRDDIKAEALAPEIEEQILEMALASNDQFGEFNGGSERLKKEVRQKLAYGLGPRAWSSLTLALKAEKYFSGKNPGVLEEEKQALRTLMHGTLTHRLALNEDYEAEARAAGDQDPRRSFVETLYQETRRDAAGQRR